MDWIWLVFAVVALLYLWQRRSLISKQQVAALIQEGAVLVDVRSAGEYRDDHVEGALNLPLDRLDEIVHEQLKDQGKPVLLYCLSGTRSAAAARRLKGLGYERVHNLGSLGRARSALEGAG